jgi:DNA ligase 1
MKFLEISKVFQEIETTSSRNEMSKILSEFFVKCSSEEIQIVSYMIQGRVAPMFVNAEFNYSEKSLLKVLNEYTNKDISKLRQKKGDIGNTLYHIWEQESAQLEIKEVYDLLWKVLNVRGTGSVLNKNKIILNSLQKLSPLEAKYFVRIVCGQLRLGLSVKSLLDVFSISVMGDKSLRDILERSYGVCADIGLIAQVVFSSKKGKERESLQKVSVRPGTPVLSRLVERVGSFEEVFERFTENVILQPKFDGLRCQVHKWPKEKEENMYKDSLWFKYLNNEEGVGNLFSTPFEYGNEVKLFTRNLEDVTEMFPEIVESARNLPYDSFILDSEIVGWNYKKNVFLSYQETMQRRRKYSVASKMDTLPVKAFVFDILYLNEAPLIDTDTKERVEVLNTLELHTTGGIVKAEDKVISNKEELRTYFDKCISEGLEGVIVKQFSGGYRPGARNFEWVKLKKSMEKKLVDTIDMVIVGYYYGSGRRSGLGLGAVLGAIYNKERDTFDSITKIGTGMGDELLKDMSEKLNEISLDKAPKNVEVVDALKPDIWVHPKYVITVDADEITKRISNGQSFIGGGLSLRFPRLVEFDRDKSPEEVTTVEELIELYELRKK